MMCLSMKILTSRIKCPWTGMSSQTLLSIFPMAIIFTTIATFKLSCIHSHQTIFIKVFFGIVISFSIGVVILKDYFEKKFIKKSKIFFREIMHCMDAYHSGSEYLKKSRPKKLVKSNT